MALTAKPYTTASKIVKRIFAGTPSIYADVDINQIADLDVSSFNETSRLLGASSINFEPIGVINAWTSLGSIDIDIDFVRSSTSRVFFKKCFFDIPSFSFSTGARAASTFIPDSYVAIYLIAEKYTVTFASNPTISGITGTGIVSPLPSSDAVIYRNERVALGIGGALPSISGTEEIICMLGQTVFSPDSTHVLGYSPTFVSMCPDESVDVTTDYTFQQTNKVSGLWANFNLLRKAFKKLYQDFSTFSTTGVLSLVRSTENRYTATQEENYVSLISVSGYGWISTGATISGRTYGCIYVPKTGNFFEVEVPAGLYWTGNIRFSDGSGTYSDIPAGTQITLKITYSGGALSDPTPANVHLIDLTPSQSNIQSSFSQYQIDNDGKTLSGLNGVQIMHHVRYGSYPDIITFRKSSSYWYITSMDRTNILSRRISDISTLLANGSWTNLTMVNSWVAIVGQEPQYKLDALGYVHLRGCVKRSVSTTGNNILISTLPGTARPNRVEYFSAICYSHNITGLTAVQVYIDSDGLIIPTNSIAGASLTNLDGANDYLSFSGITFSIY